MDLNKNWDKINKCRISDSNILLPILDLGAQPLANSLKKTKNEFEPKYPLSISFCPKSYLVQLNETINKNKLFKNYIWLTGTSATANTYADIFSKKVINKLKIEKDDFIVEIASNDGTFLNSFLKKNYKNILGIDSASNLAELANNIGIKTLPEFMNSETANYVVSKYKKAKVVIARNVIPHVSDILDVMKGINILLEDDGFGIIEFHNAKTIIEELHYDSIYHEHLFYFSIKSMTFLLNIFNLIPFDIFFSPISGGSCVLFFSKKLRNKSFKLEKAIEDEEEAKINELITWKKFANDVINHKSKTKEFFTKYKEKKIVGFGSSARSQTYLNYCEITSDDIKFIIDNNSLKHNYFTPGSSIPIGSLDKGINLNPDIIFVLAWNFQEEIIQISKKNNFKGDFYIPFPNLPYFKK